MLDTAIGHGIRRLVSVPVHGEGGEMFGVLEVGSGEAGEFAPCDLLFLQELADCIGAAVRQHADRARRADRATLVAERRRAVREPQLGGLRWPEVPTGADGRCRDQRNGGRTGFPAPQNAARRRQAPAFGGLQQDAQMRDGGG